MIKIYDRKETNFSRNGLAILNECISALIIHEFNGEYSLEIEYPSTSKKVKYLKKYHIIKADGQLFRIYRIEKKKDNIKVWARHITYDLAFFFFEETILSSGATVKYVINKIKEGTPFNISTDIDYRFQLPVVFEEINHLEALFQMIEMYGGELSRDNFNISLNYQMGEDKGILISYGKNIQGVTETLNLDSVITRLYPVGADDIRLHEKYIDSSLINHPDYPPYPIPKKVSFDVYDEWTLKSVAKEYLKIVEKPKATYEIDFIELEKSSEYKMYASLQKVNLGDLVTVRHLGMGIDIHQKIIRYEKDLLEGFKSKIVLGDAKEDFTDFQQALLNAKEVVDYAFRKGKLNSATLKGLKIINEEKNEVTFEITEEGDTFIYGKLTIGPGTEFEDGYDPTDKADKNDLGELAYHDAVEKALLGETIIEGGYLKTGFVDATRIDTGTLNVNQVNIEAKDAENNTVIKIGKIDEEDENSPARFGLRITGDNGQLMLDEYGIDPRFVKAYKNLIWNSSFERFDPLTKIPQYWTGGQVTEGVNFDNTYSMKLDVGQMSEQAPSAGGYTPRPDPDWWGNKQTRISFFKKGGDVQVQVFSEYDFTPFELTGEDGESKSYYNTGHSSNWDEGRYTFSFEPNKTGRIWIRFSNIGSSAAYIDAVQMEPDFNGKYPSFYTNGPYSVSADEVPLSDTWLEYINVPYSQNIKVGFNQRYSLPPTITANLIRNRNGANSGSSFGNYNISPNIDLIIEEEQGFLFYTGVHISFGTSAPSSVANGYISIQIVGRV